MLKLAFRPSEIKYVACSGGGDSMCLLSFLINGDHKPEVLYFNHKTEFGDKCEKFVKDYCNDNKLKYHIETLNDVKKKHQSQEEFWRFNRYKFLNKFKDGKVATAHHLKDVAETYIFYATRGNPRIIPPINGNYIRPLILCTHEDILQWNNNYNIPFMEDPSNNDIKYSRNKIRHEILPMILEVSPGFYKTMWRKVKEALYEQKHVRG